MVKFSLALLSSFVVIGALSGSADDVLPPRFNFDRYRAMVDRSPFAIATAPALPEATPNFAKDLYVGNAARSAEGDMVTIRSSSDQNFKKYLTTREPVDGYSIAQIDWSEDVGKTKVTISKDGQFASLTFNQALLAQQQGRQAGALAALSGGAIQQNPKAAPASTPHLVPARTPSLAPIAVPNLDAREAIDLQQLQLEQQRRQQEDEEQLAREKESVGK